jgi:hypothetical protein
MNPNRGCNRSDRILQRRVSWSRFNDGCRVARHLAAGMTGRHGRLSAMPRHVVAALVLRSSWGETQQQTRHRRCRCPLQDDAQHDGSSYAVHSHEFISLSIARQETSYQLVQGCAVTAVTAGCRRPRRYCFYVQRHFDATGNAAESFLPSGAPSHNGSQRMTNALTRPVKSP